MYDVNELAKIALDARKDSFCFISHFAVGAALLGESGTIWRGMNIECSGQNPTLCAERVALFKALSEGEKKFTALAVAGGPEGAPPADFCAPCGVCRQALVQFCDQEMPVYLVKSETEIETYTLEQLLPVCFVRRPETMRGEI